MCLTGVSKSIIIISEIPESLGARSRGSPKDPHLELYTALGPQRNHFSFRTQGPQSLHQIPESLGARSRGSPKDPHLELYTALGPQRNHFSFRTQGPHVSLLLVGCGNCDRWFHQCCTELPKNTDVSSIHFACFHCK